MMTILIAGGAGYIGSHMVLSLLKAGQQVIVLDNLSSGKEENIPKEAIFVQGAIDDESLLDSLFSEYKIDAVMHFAAFIEVGESVVNPQKYYQNNVVVTLTLLNKMVEHKIKNFIFSSTAAIFGEPQYVPIDINHPKNPVNPYGRSKLMVEQILQDYDQAYDLKSVCLRYFNESGADPELRTGECHDPESHLIPLFYK
jgi:UDP-glucose 4-epimerase